jgi:hypothetical protein
MRPGPFTLPLLGCLAATACADFATPAELTKPTVLAVIADPPLARPGQTTALSVVVAGPDGPMEPDAVSWRLIETWPGAPVFGTLEPTAGATATFQAPRPLPELPDGVEPVVSVESTVEAAGTQVVVIKGLLVIDLPSQNPTIPIFAIGGQVVDDTVRLRAGAPYELDVAVEPRPGERARFAWYSTAGTIERYQSNPTVLTARDEPGEGWIFVVARDGLGGVAWRAVAATIE